MCVPALHTIVSVPLHYHFFPSHLDNPITTPGVDKTECMNKSTNDQFRYETEKELEAQLQQEYGKVSHILLTHCNYGFIISGACDVLYRL